MKRRLIAITAFLAVALTGCGQIDEPLITTESNNQPAAQIEVETEKMTDSYPESTTEIEKTTTAKQTTETTSVESTTTISIAETTPIETSVSAITETDNVSQPQTENIQDIPQEVTVQDTKISENNDTSAYANSVTTSTEPITDAPVQVDTEISEIFRKLNSLHYESMTCDGIPEKTFVAEDGTVFAVNFSERWVWRNGVEEAKLTDELYNALVDSEPISLY